MGAVAAITNLSFETAGASPGLAASWTLVATATAMEIGTFGADGSPIEGFEAGWGTTYLAAFATIDLSAGYFSADFFASPARKETFEAGWLNTTYYLAFPASAAGQFATRAYEDFEPASWSNPDQRAFEPADLVAAPMDTFESGWSNAGYVTAFTVELSEAIYSGQYVDSRETFERVLLANGFTVNTGANEILTEDPSNVAVGMRVRVKAADGDSLPGGLRPDVPYFVLAIVDGWSFTVSRANAGPVVDIVTMGDGLFTVTAPYEHWTTPLTTV